MIGCSRDALISNFAKTHKECEILVLCLHMHVFDVYLSASNFFNSYLYFFLSNRLMVNLQNKILIKYCSWTERFKYCLVIMRFSEYRIYVFTTLTFVESLKNLYEYYEFQTHMPTSVINGD